ncbi:MULTISPECIES: CaiB/BaiF CoA transferase family protein [Bordetella]|uniref:CoA transferase n=1 Tax=Bordetella genomosp. 6 TaxID=463024 RepID=A0ABX4FCT3_9BORD|nr:MULTISPECIES: CaiB/BaiF CoA-transferase family protein [Bordetella]AOB29144.1 alpha-methylacyl-CoA racemase [Bordetella bronchiseptica]AWP77526.1 CoA transferase [Bordetella bronchiseptica]AZW46483.1 CoA transferase [Bordetella bronchiseptica]KDB67958.1 CoA-transferase family III protein [Bordetella bronchiseptica B20-10725633]KFJ46567.1 coA-transferase III family protein [Bordetella bronchiseptica]
MTRAAPLAGISVVDFSELLPGPFLTQNLLELGATVVKVERPPHGDNARRLYPGVYASVNRGKRGEMLDLKQAEGRARARELVAGADVLVEGFRPGVMARLGLDYEQARALNERLVYVSLSGYGQDGPQARQPGHDINYLAAAGALALAGSDPAEPAPGAGLPVADLCGAMYALSSTLAALLQRQHTGRGQWLDVALADCVMHWMNPRLGQFASAGLATLAQQRHDVLCKPAYGVFRTADDAHVAIAALEDHFWQALRGALPLAGLAGPLATYREREAQAGPINDALARAVRGRTCQALMEVLTAADVPVSRVELPGELGQSALARQRGLFDAGDGYARYPVRLDHMGAA